MALTLPDKKSEINRNYCDQKIALIGQSGIGKSELFTHDPKAFFIEAEAGLNAYEVFKLSARNWQDIIEIYKLLYAETQKPGDFPYDIIVVDTIDKIVEYAEEETVMKAKQFFKRIAEKINTIGEVPEGGGWNTCRKMVMGFLSALQTLPACTAFVGHITTKYMEPDFGQKYTRETVSIWGKLGLDILAWSDHTLFVNATLKGTQLYRTVHTKPTQSKEAKSRGNMVPDGWKWVESSKENYEYFRNLFV